MANLSPENARRLMDTLGYVFSDPMLFMRALTHRSASSQNNERLEFLGDSVLNLIITRYLFEHLPQGDEGALTRIRAKLVCESSLAKLAETFRLGNYLILGVGEQKSGGAYRASIMADALEALIAAIYLEAGMLVCEPLILSWFQADLADLALAGKTHKDAKTRLQEVLQAKQLELPLYHLKDSFGDPHEPTFRISCQIPSLGIETEGQAKSRKKAEQLAAESALAILSSRTL